MASAVAAGRAATSIETERRAPAEGWVSVLLHAALLVVMASAIGRVDEGERLGILVPLALGGGVIGFVLAKSRFVDLFAHLTAFLTGVVAAVGISAVRYDDIGGSWRTSLDNLQIRAERLYDALEQSTPLDDDLLVAVIGITIWLVGYSSAWMLYRRRWLGPSTMLPGVVILTSLGLDRDAKATPIFVYLVIAMVLAARHFAFRRQQDWRRARIAAPPSLPSRFLVAGSVIGAIAVSVGIVLPVQAPEQLVDSFADRGERIWARLEREWERVPFPGQGGDSGRPFDEFTEDFELGQPFNPTDEEVALLDSDRAMYLAVRRNNVYDGRGWSSDVDESFRLPGESKDVRATRATFIPGQSVPFSSDVTGERRDETATVTVLRSDTGVLFTIGTHVSSSMPTTVVLSWWKFDDLAVEIESFDPSSVPNELTKLVSLLQSAQFEPAPDGGEPTVVQPGFAEQIAAEQASLRANYAVETRIELVEGRAVLHVSGRFPDYDDIEAVFVTDPNNPNSRYTVSGSFSAAEPGDLRTAGTDYPDNVQSRYLQMSDTVTDRTRQLSQQIVDAAGAANPFDQAIALEAYLRSPDNYTYVLNSTKPREGNDFVDDFLFNRKEGRCEEFATSMIVMLRTLDIPARLVRGYNPGFYDPARTGYIYVGMDAHTWVEAYFPGYGWIPFEPTPPEDQFTYGEQAQLPDRTPEPTPTPQPTPAPETTPTVEPTATPIAAPTQSDRDDTSLRDTLIERLTWLPTLLSLVTLGGVLVLIAAWLWGLRGLRPGAALYARALRIGRIWGVEPEASMTPGEYADEFARSVPGARTAIRVVADLYTAEQYGQQQAGPAVTTTGRAAWKELRGSLARWRPWRRGRARSGIPAELNGD